ncbi:MAG: chromate transporter [Rikenellaceae bacterium]
MLYLQILFVYLKIGFFGFGGGYAMLSLIHNEIVVNHQWLSEMELTDIIAISQMTPGPIAINSATYVGYSVTGNIWGAILATLAVCTPAMTLMLLITRFYIKLRDNKYISSAMEGMKPMLVAMIASAAVLLLSSPENCIDTFSWIILGAAFILSLFKVNPILLIVLAGVAGFIIYG